MTLSAKAIDNISIFSAGMAITGLIMWAANQDEPATTGNKLNFRKTGIAMLVVGSAVAVYTAMKK